MTELAQHTETDPFTSSLAGRRLGRYEVLARLATGGMAGVYVARALGVAGFERLFAVKVLHPHLAHEEEFITMFLDEARLAARIRHPNVVPTTDISDTADAGYYLVMDYIEGDHLGALLQHAFRNHGRIPAPVVLRIVVDALEGLGAAHGLTNEHGQPLHLVHRDVSPHNIMVSTDGVARITDFGVAKASVRLSTTQDGQFKGKLAYMAPEHASNGQSDQRSDLFAMAIILWESLTGRRLFRAENHAATLHKICLEPIPLPSEVDPGLVAFDPILARGLARSPDDRFQTAEEFAEAIEAHADELGGMANQRTVAKLVKEYAAEKLERDRGLIRAAIQELGASSQRAGDVPMAVGQSGTAPRSAAGIPPVSQAQQPGPQAQPGSQALGPDPAASPAAQALPAEGASAVASWPVEHQGFGASSVAPAELELPTQEPRRPWALWLGAALAMAAIGVSMTTLMWEDGQPSPEQGRDQASAGSAMPGGSATEPTGSEDGVPADPTDVGEDRQAAPAVESEGEASAATDPDVPMDETMDVPMDETLNETMGAGEPPTTEADETRRSAVSGREAGERDLAGSPGPRAARSLDGPRTRNMANEDDALKSRAARQPVGTRRPLQETAGGSREATPGSARGRKAPAAPEPPSTLQPRTPPPPPEDDLMLNPYR